VSSHIAPGWYPDPQSAGQVRYWDGTGWTEYVQAAGGEPAAGDGAAGARVFTSDLSANELLLLGESGFEPLGVVSGTSVYQIGFEQSHWTRDQEIEPLSRALLRGRELALSRAAEQAAGLGAHGVVSLRLKVGGYEWAPNMAEFVAVGTAVEQADAAAPESPFATDLSGQELWALRRAGFRPVGLALGTCVYHVAYGNLGQLFRQYGPNAEIDAYTTALGGARELAFERMRAHAERLEADGVVSVDLKERSHGWGSHVIEFLASGTAVVATGEPPAEGPAEAVVPLGR
jgi:uncharacterized protein YbjQ (UPF0145 family)